MTRLESLDLHENSLTGGVMCSQVASASCQLGTCSGKISCKILLMLRRHIASKLAEPAEA
jgi:hypothetical protein